MGGTLSSAGWPHLVAAQVSLSQRMHGCFTCCVQLIMYDQHRICVVLGPDMLTGLSLKHLKSCCRHEEYRGAKSTKPPHGSVIVCVVNTASAAGMHGPHPVTEAVWCTTAVDFVSNRCAHLCTVPYGWCVVQMQLSYLAACTISLTADPVVRMPSMLLGNRIWQGRWPVGVPVALPAASTATFAWDTSSASPQPAYPAVDACSQLGAMPRRVTPTLVQTRSAGARGLAAPTD